MPRIQPQLPREDPQERAHRTTAVWRNASIDASFALAGAVDRVETVGYRTFVSTNPEQVLEFAFTTLHELAPELVIQREPLALRVVCDGDRALVWNLHDQARLATTDPHWRERVRDQARELIERLATAFADKPKLGGVGVRLRPDARVPAELRTGEYAAERVLEGIWALYGERNADGISIRPWATLLGDTMTREQLRTLAAVTTLGEDFRYRDMMTPMGEGIPVFTNAEFHANVAAALLMPAGWWRLLIDGMKPRPATLLAMVPAPSRIFISPVDVPEMVHALRSLVPSSEETEEELLSTHVYRFDGECWTAVPSH